MDDARDTSIYGIKRACSFDAIDYFEVTTSFPPDVMHDCLEGVIPVTVSLVLGRLHDMRLISIQSLNDKLSEISFPALP